MKFKRDYNMQNLMYTPQQQLMMDSNASTPATQRREHTLLQNLGYHHHHLVSIVKHQ
jgi:hypothetical protein